MIPTKESQTRYKTEDKNGCRYRIIEKIILVHIRLMSESIEYV